MEKVYGYIRVSTAKQGKGVSLVEQKDAIDAYAKRNNLLIVKWFEELETAAKTGRPVFSHMLKLLKKGKAVGVIMHKIDRSARNMRDWSELTELADKDGVQVHFVQESVNLLRNNDRLSADMQAVVASHYIRNLRQETIKGLYGRLKQGIYPFKAPIGYLDTGAGNPKKIDPQKAPFVKKIFDFYLTEQWGVIGLGNHMYHLGLRNTNGGVVTKQTISKILNNPFYAGIMRVAGKTFPGKHQPLISIRDFEMVSLILAGKTSTRSRKHNFTYSKLLKCSGCNRSLIGEIQKGIHYYRCHTKTCPVKCLREDYFETNLFALFNKIELSETDADLIKSRVDEKLIEKNEKREIEKSSIDLQLNQIQSRTENLLDLLIEGVIDQNIYAKKNEKLLFRLQELKERKMRFNEGNRFYKERLEGFIELVISLNNNYKIASKEKKRYMVKKVTSNRLISPKNVDIQLFPVFAELSKRTKFKDCDLERDDSRTTTTESANNNVIKKSNSSQKKMKRVKLVNEKILKRVAEQFISDQNYEN